MKSNEVIQTIRSRRSVRKYSQEAISKENISTMLDCARFAPSGLNNQPWRFILMDDSKIKRDISELTHYSDIVSLAPLLIAVFLDTASSYHREKDLMAVGASIQNILLSAHSLGIGAVWLGEILKNKESVSKILNAPEEFELTAVLAIGYPDEENPGTKNRKSLDEIVFQNQYSM
ncbi:MAG: nitroreductase family protein [Methanimicrococcus sp.]|nr:nitroreductase family protein [Methanimicrococcus sp.]